MGDSLTTGCVKITPPASGIYMGVFAQQNDNESAETMSANIVDFESIAGTDADIVVLFIPFSSGPIFPASVANTVAKKNGVVFIKLEPWDTVGKGKEKKSYSLKDIAAGNFDLEIKRFSIYARDFYLATGKPIFLSFAHEMNFDKDAWSKNKNSARYPWSGDPQAYIAAYQRVHKIMSETAPNITWVWNVNVDAPAMEYYPGDEYVDWIAIDGYDHTGKRGPQHLFNGNPQDPKNPKVFSSLKKLGKPIMIGEYACGGNKTECLKKFIDFTADPENKIKAIVYFNRDKDKHDWKVKTEEEKKALHDAIKLYEQLFKGRIETVPCEGK